MIYSDVIYGAVPTSEITLNKNELLARIGMGNEFDLDKLKPYIDKLDEVIIYKYAYTEVDLQINDTVCDFGFVATDSKALSCTLAGSKKAYILAVTLGIDVDRLIAKSNIQSPAEAYYIDAIASCAAESLAEYIYEKLSSHKECTHRFSPGYADLPLQIQPKLLERLNAYKAVGITLTDELLMIPTKSITTIIGIK